MVCRVFWWPFDTGRFEEELSSAQLCCPCRGSCGREKRMHPIKKTLCLALLPSNAQKCLISASLPVELED